MKVKATITTKVYESNMNNAGDDKARIVELLRALDADPKYGDLVVDIREVRSPSARTRDH